ncbi:MAG TPA: hypothetical protein VJK51_02170 [Candidatus Nanoarchaeia archaeon]|nr:hypothetical protein [Candidatus Nanoarchaeia archaeon]
MIERKLEAEQSGKSFYWEVRHLESKKFEDKYGFRQIEEGYKQSSLGDQHPQNLIFYHHHWGASVVIRGNLIGARDCVRIVGDEKAVELAVRDIQRFSSDYNKKLSEVVL